MTLQRGVVSKANYRAQLPLERSLHALSKLTVSALLRPAQQRYR